MEIGINLAITIVFVSLFFFAAVVIYITSKYN